VPQPTRASPTGRNSNSANGGMPRRARKLLAAMFVDVPTRVQHPPSIAPNATGIRSLDGARSALRETASTTGVNTAVTTVLFMKADTADTTRMMLTSRTR